MKRAEAGQDNYIIASWQCERVPLKRVGMTSILHAGVLEQSAVFLKVQCQKIT